MSKNPNNQVVVAGIFTDASFNIYNNDETIFTILQNSFDATTSQYIVMYDETGAVQWATKITPTTTDGFLSPPQVCVDTQQNVYLLCSFTQTNIQLYNANTLLYQTTFTGNSNYQNHFLIKYSAANGEILWTTEINGNDYSEITKITIDPFNNLLLIGQWNSTLYFYDRNGFFQSQTTTTPTTPFGFILQYNSNGEAQWLNVLQTDVGGVGGGGGGGGGYVNCTDIGTDKQGNSYLVGQMNAVGFYLTNREDDMVIATFIGTETAINDNLKSPSLYLFNNAYIIKYDVNGNLVWTNQLQTAYIQCTVDLNGFLYITAMNYDTLKLWNQDTTLFYQQQIPAAAYDKTTGFIMKYNTTAGNPVWVASLQNAVPTAANQHVLLYDLAVDTYNQRLYIAGNYSYGQLDVYNAAPKTLAFSLTDNTRGFILQYNATDGTALRSIDAGNSLGVGGSFLSAVINGWFYSVIHDNTQNILEKYDATNNAVSPQKIWTNVLLNNDNTSNTLTVSQYGLPLPPINISAVFVEEVGNAVSISWTPFPNQFVLQYILTAYSTTDSSGNAPVVFSTKTIENTDNAIVQYNYTGLGGGEYYTFNINAVSLVGTGITSLFTIPAVLVKSVPDMPVLVEVSPTQRENTVSIVWSAPFDGGSPILRYLVSLLNFKNEMIMQQTKTTVDLMVEVGGLNAGQFNTIAYYFVVVAVNVYGNSAALVSPFVYPFQRVIVEPVIYKKLITGGNNPQISKSLRYAQYVGRRGR